MNGNNDPAMFFAGLIVGVLAVALILGLAVMPMVETDQFKKDCVSMAHGTVDKSAKNICVKDGKILFHQ